MHVFACSKQKQESNPQLNRTMSSESGNFENPLYSPDNTGGQYANNATQQHTAHYHGNGQVGIPALQNGGAAFVSHIPVGVPAQKNGGPSRSAGQTEPIYSDPLPPYTSKYFGSGSSNPASELGASTSSHYDLPPRKQAGSGSSVSGGHLVLPSPEDVGEIPTKRPV